MLTIDLTGEHVVVAGVADDGGFGFAIAKALAEAGATVAVATCPPALGIFKTMLERGKFDASLAMKVGSKLTFSKIYLLYRYIPKGVYCAPCSCNSWFSRLSAHLRL